MSANPELRVGQVWADNDPRSAGRTIEIIATDLVKDRSTTRYRNWGRVLVTTQEPAVRVRTLTVARNVSESQIGRETLILATRFRPTKTGYVLVKDAPGVTP